MRQPNASTPGGFGRRAGRAFTRFLITVVVMGLAGAVAYLVSMLNARTFTLEQQDGNLVVMKGRMFPVGAAPFHPSDAFQADAYAPVSLEGQPVSSALLQQRFTERDELDRALFDVLEKLSRPRVDSEDPKALDQGLYYLRRAGKLSGITDEQRRSLKQLEAEVAFYQARQKLEDARRLVAEALTQLRLAGESKGRNARSANQMLSEVEPSAKGLSDSLRKAVHSLSAPAEVSPPPEAPEKATAPAASPTAQPEGTTPQAPTPPASVGGASNGTANGASNGTSNGTSNGASNGALPIPTGAPKTP